MKICTVKPARLVLLHEIGRGGSSIVYLVQDRVSGERYAMKALKQNMCEEVAITEMDIRKEAAILETLGKEQTGIPAFYGMLGETALSGFLKEVSGGEAASTGFLMEYIEGESLQKILEDGKVFTVREAAEAGLSFCAILKKLHEMNPMLGHRGCRLAITYPEIVEMQAEAIISAALEVRREEGLEIVPEIMVPLVAYANELKYVKKIIIEVADRLIAESGENMRYLIGTMIEIPRAAITADEIAEEAEFFSFGTNDLTQMGLGFSRDDTGNLIKEYLARGVIESDPFQSLDQTGVGKLVKVAAEGGRRTRPNIKLGICGEHGGDPATIHFCHKVGLSYVSCSPFRVPIARLAAAQAAINDKKNNPNA